jgi:hypothetical protein
MNQEIRKVNYDKSLEIEIILGEEEAPKGNTGIPREKFTYSDATEPVQIPLCMIGDSITWAEKGDYWRKYLLEKISRLAFVGTHSALFGYSHAGEGGNDTKAVLKRFNMIPDCPYYSLLIGTNDTGVKDASISQQRAVETAERIQKIVMKLLKKPGVKKVFLCSILPCFTINPLRDKTNSLTNDILREKMKTVFPKDKVIWVEFEEPIRAIKGWEPKIELHPTIEGYKIIAKIHADKIAKELILIEISKTVESKNGTGVRVRNLWDSKVGTTVIPIIAGWYTISFDVKKVLGNNPELKITGILSNSLSQSFKISASEVGKRMTINTSYQGANYCCSKLKLEPVNCEVDKILFEKSRPSQKASIYGKGIYMDLVNNPSPGELIEKNN